MEWNYLTWGAAVLFPLWFVLWFAFADRDTGIIGGQAEKIGRQLEAIESRVKEGNQILERLLDRLEVVEAAVKARTNTSPYSNYQEIISKLEDIESAVRDVKGSVEEGASDIASELKEVQSAIDLK